MFLLTAIRSHWNPSACCNILQVVEGCNDSYVRPLPLCYDTTKSQEPVLSQLFTERPLVTLDDREPEHHPVRKALLCMGHIQSSCNALLLDNENGHATGGSRHIKPQLSLPANWPIYVLVSFSIPSHTHLFPPSPPPTKAKVTDTTIP